MKKRLYHGLGMALLLASPIWIAMADEPNYVNFVLSAVLGPESPQLVLLDDIDKALHPQAQKELVRVIRAILAQFPELQIVATSHSPYLVDEFAADEVWVRTFECSICPTGRGDADPVPPRGRLTNRSGTE